MASIVAAQNFAGLYSDEECRNERLMLTTTV